MDKIRNIALRTERFVDNHRVGIAITATALVCYRVHRGAVKEWNDFLDTKGLKDEYYAVTEDE